MIGWAPFSCENKERGGAFRRIGRGPGALPGFSLGFAVFYFCTWFQHVFVEGSRVPLAGGQNGGGLCFVCPGGCPPASYVVVKRRRVSPLFPAALLCALVAAPAELGARPRSGSPASPDEKELPHLGKKARPIEKKEKRKDPHTGSLPFSYSQREQRTAAQAAPNPGAGGAKFFPPPHTTG